MNEHRTCKAKLKSVLLQDDRHEIISQNLIVKEEKYMLTVPESKSQCIRLQAERLDKIFRYITTCVFPCRKETDRLVFL